ncbi:MAG: hypothetical protein R6U96_18305 [Promethearchaeia archaeon]
MSDKSDLDILDDVVKDFAPEVADIYYIREDEAEEKQIKTGRLHENRILGIILNYYIEGKKKVTTSEVEGQYKLFFKDIARSTISTYLNMLKKESTLYKERDGRIVYYIFFEDPPVNIQPFWFTRIFCIVPPYFIRAIYLAKIYAKADGLVKEYSNNKDIELLTKNFKFLVGLIILHIMKNRCDKCVYCQFSQKEIYTEMCEGMEMSIKDRSDVLPNDLTNLLQDYGEIPMFGGKNIHEKYDKEQIIKELIDFADKYKKDLEFQIMVSSRRTDLRMRQKERQKGKGKKEKEEEKG